MCNNYYLQIAQIFVLIMQTKSLIIIISLSLPPFLLTLPSLLPLPISLVSFGTLSQVTVTPLQVHVAQPLDASLQDNMLKNLLKSLYMDFQALEVAFRTMEEEEEENITRR